jgi:hypothetical protein
MTVTCPACGSSFETTAITKTRCRRCRQVVNIGQNTRAVRAEGNEEAPYENYEPTPGGSGWGLLALLAGGALAVWRGSRSANVGDLSPTEPVVPEQPLAPTGLGI